MRHEAMIRKVCYMYIKPVAAAGRMAAQDGVSDEALVEQMVRLNPWWMAGSVPTVLVKAFRRRDHAALARHMDKPEAQTILGARRVGKTTMLYQLAADLVSSGTDPRRILFLSLEAQGIDPNAESLRRVLEVYARSVLDESIYALTKRAYVILDEVHLIKGWQVVVKHFYDQAWPVKFVVSGSSAADILAGSSESLVGRVWHQTLLPMSFAEFVEFNNPRIVDAVESAGSAMRSGLIKSVEIGDALSFYESAKQASLGLAMHKEAIRTGLAGYMRHGGYPATVTYDSSLEKSEAIRMYIDLSLHKDAVRSSNVRNHALLNRMFHDFAWKSPRMINVTRMSRDLGVSKSTVDAYGDALKWAFLVSFAEFYTPRPSIRHRRDRKVYVNDVGVRNAVVSPLASGDPVTDHTEAGRMAETVAADHTRRLWHTLEPMSAPAMPHYWHNGGGLEVDLVMTLRQRPIPVEVKYRQRVNESDLGGLSRFSAKFDPPLAVAVSRNDLRLAMGETTVVVPLWLYLLMC